MLRGKRILLVDGDPGIRKSLTIFFRSIDNCVVSTAENGWQALQILAKAQFDFILCDLVLPDMAGKDLIARIRAVCRETTSIILMVPCEGNNKGRQSPLGLRGIACLEKPFSGDEVAAFLVATGPLSKKNKINRGAKPLQAI
jgi:two-component system KDP operon response regulator KdpE